MEYNRCFPSKPFVVLTVYQFVGHCGGSLEGQKRDMTMKVIFSVMRNRIAAFIEKLAYCL